jgi:hypothetical protein
MPRTKAENLQVAANMAQAVQALAKRHAVGASPASQSADMLLVEMRHIADSMQDILTFLAAADVQPGPVQGVFRKPATTTEA